MIINTVGRIILKDGKLVFERFGAAVVQKIKLGTSAFANIVNNATTTEEGFVPDARVVAQQQETISALQEQVDSLNSAKIRKTTVTGTTNAVGNIVLFVNDNNVKVVYCECNQYICVPFRFNSAIFGKVINVNSDTFSQHANAEVNIDVYYYY